MKVFKKIIVFSWFICMASCKQEFVPVTIPVQPLMMDDSVFVYQTEYDTIQLYINNMPHDSTVYHTEYEFFRKGESAVIAIDSMFGYYEVETQVFDSIQNNSAGITFRVMYGINNPDGSAGDAPVLNFQVYKNGQFLYSVDTTYIDYQYNNWQ